MLAVGDFLREPGPRPRAPCSSIRDGREKTISPKGEQLMSILAWIILGLIAGFIGSKIVNKRGEGMFLDIGLGIVGAVVGFWLFNRYGMAVVSWVNLYSLLVAVIGSVLILVVYHALTGKRS